MGIPGSANPLLLAQQGSTQYQVSRSLRFNSSDSGFLSRTPSSAGNRKTWTWAGWVKRSGLGAFQDIWGNGDASALNGFLFRFDSGDKIDMYDLSSSVQWRKVTTQVFRDASAWYHLVISYDTTNATAGDRVRLYVNGERITAFSSSSDPSLNYDGYINNTNPHAIGRTGQYNGLYLSGYLADIHFIDSQALTPSAFGEFDTNGVWQPIAYAGTYGTNGFHLPFSDNSTAAALGTDTSGNGNTWTVNNLSVTTFTAASWTYSATGGIVNQGNITDNSLSTFAYSATAGSSEGAVSLSVNTSGAPIVVPSGQNLVVYVNSGTGAGQRKVRVNGGAYVNCDANAKCTFPGPLTVTSIDSTLGPNVGGGFSATIAGIELNGILLVSGDTTDSLVDSPTNYGTDTGAGGEVRGNYATLNPLFSSATLTNGNLDAEGPTNAWHIARGTIAFPTSDKWYWEATVTGTAAASYAISVATAAAANSVGDVTTATGLYGIVNNTGTTTTKFINGTASTISTAAAWAQNDILMCAYDGATGKVWFGRNGTWYPPTSGGTAGDPAAGTNETMTASGTVFPAVHCYGTSGDMAANFGQRPFAYTAPSGFKALCTANLPTPTIANGATAMDVKLYTGNGSTQTISGLNFSPDLVWIKARNAVNTVNRPHQVFDTVREAPKALSPNRTDAEDASGGYDNDGALTAFTSDGFTVESGPAVGNNSSPYVAWAWDAGSSTVANTQGSITSQVRANASAGFSIVTYTGNGVQGATVAHGLGVAPSMVIYKQRSASRDWLVYHASLGATAALYLNQTLGAVTSANHFNNTAPNSTTLYLNSSPPADQTNVNGGTYVAYCFAPVAGYSAFGSYVGNGSADGPLIYTGFRPRFLMIKASSISSEWLMLDTARSDFNFVNDRLQANSSAAEDNLADLDILSSGFKMRSGSLMNNNGATFLYCAWAENPFQYARAR